MPIFGPLMWHILAILLQIHILVDFEIMWWCTNVKKSFSFCKFFILTLYAPEKVEKQVKSQTSYNGSFPKARDLEWAVFAFAQKKFRKVEANQTPEKVGRKERSKLGSKR